MRRTTCLAALIFAPLLACAAQAEQSPAAADWQVAGRLGLATFIVIPTSAAADEAYYHRAIESLCPAEASCWLRFFTNSTGAALALPLPEAIEREPTAIFQRSAKAGGRTMFRWSCRVQVAGAVDCF